VSRFDPHAGPVYAQAVTFASSPVKLPAVDPGCWNVPRINDGGFEELCHLVSEDDPDTAFCGKDVSDYPWNPPWPVCEACLAVSRGRMN